MAVSQVMADVNVVGRRRNRLGDVYKNQDRQREREESTLNTQHIFLFF